MPSQRMYRAAFLAILAVALAVRLVAAMWWQQRVPPGGMFAFPDSESYWELGRRIVRGQPYEFGPERYAIFRTPGYPILLAGLFLLNHEPPVLCGRALSAVLGTIAVAGVASLARQLFDRRTALLAAGLAALYPEAIALSTFVLSEAPFCPLMVWQLVAWTKAWKAGDRGAGRLQLWSAIAGILGGLATLMRPSWLLFAPFAAILGPALIALAARNALEGADLRERNATEGVPYRVKLLRHFQIVAILLATTAMTMLPWWARNYLIAGRFVPTTLQVGASLYDGLSPMATGASDMRFVAPFVAQQRAADEQSAELVGTFEDRLDRRMRDASLAWARANPDRVVQLAWIKLRRMWSPLPNAAEFGGNLTRFTLVLTYTPAIVLAAIGAFRFSRRGWPYLLLLLPAVYFTCLHVIFVSSIRYRQPAMLILLVVTAGVIGEWICGRGGGRSGSRQPRQT